MAEVEETAREFEELRSGSSPPPPYVERNDETLSGRVATPPTYTARSLGLTEPQLYHRDIDPPDYSTLMQVVAAISCWFCICTLPCAIAAMALEKKVCSYVTYADISYYLTPDKLTNHQCTAMVGSYVPYRYFFIFAASHYHWVVSWSQTLNFPQRKARVWLRDTNHWVYKIIMMLTLACTIAMYKQKGYTYILV